MTFAHPTWLSLTLLLVLLMAGIVALGLRRREHLLAQFAASRLVAQLTGTISPRRYLTKAALLVCATGAIGLALARPQYGVEWVQRKARGLDLVFVLDCSKSMLASDLRPNRLERAKLSILDLVKRLESDRVGLVVFAGQAFLQTPLTLDYANFRESLAAAGPTSLTRGGSDLGSALEEAANAFPDGENTKILVLLTDGEDLAGQAEAAARRLANKNIKVFAIGIGSPEPTFLRLEDEAGELVFARDADGQPVRTQLDEPTLQSIAQITGGRYARLDTGGLEALFDDLLATLPREARESELREVRLERFQWPLAAALTLLMLEHLIRRRPSARGAGAATVLLCSALLVMPTGPAEAASDMESITAAEAAHEAIQRGDFEEALEYYQRWLQVSGDPLTQRDALYNMGHAAHQIARSRYTSGDLPGALESAQAAEDYFRSATEIDPEDPLIPEDAAQMSRIREAIEALLQQPQEDPADPQDAPQDPENASEDQQRSSDPSTDPSESGDDGDSSGESSQNPSSEADQNQAEGSPQNQPDPASQGTSQDPPSGEDDSGSGAEDSTESPQASTDPEAGQQNEAPAEPTPSGTEDESNPSGDDATEPTAEDGPEPLDSLPLPAEMGDEAAEQAGESAASQAATAGESDPTDERVREARALLDSLRGQERILPFTPGTPGQGRPIQDW